MTEKPENSQPASVPVAETTEEMADVISQLEGNKKIMLIAILGLTLAFGTVVVVRELVSQKHLAAAEAYSQAAHSRSVEELDQVVSDYPKSLAAGDALLTKSELQITSGKPEDAQVTLLTFIEKHKKHPRHAQGLFGLGNLHQIGGDVENAGKYYDRVLKEYPDSDIAPLAMIRQGDLLLAQGKKEEARQKYESIMPTYRGTPFFERIEEKIALLDVEKLPVVPAPEEPAPEPTVKPSSPAAPETAPEKPAAQTKGIPSPTSAPMSKTDEPTADKPKADKPKADKPKADKAKADKAKADKAKADKAKADKAKADKPTTEKTEPSPPAENKGEAKATEKPVPAKN